MKCRKCGFELDESNQLRSGAYACPECGTVHHTASSSRVSPSPWRRKRRSTFAPPENFFTRKLWVLPLWSWIAIVAAVIVIIVLALTLGGHSSDPVAPNMPEANDIPLVEDGQSVAGGDTEDVTGSAGGEDALLSGLDSEQGVELKETSTNANDFLVSFDWAMSYLKYTSKLSLTFEETGARGENIRTYSYEDWFKLVLTVNPETNVILSAVGTAPEGYVDRMTAAFVCMLYAFDNTMDANACAKQINAMIADTSQPFARESFVANMAYSDTAGYTLEFVGRL